MLEGENMPKPTKAQQKRLVRDILAKAKKLYVAKFSAADKSLHQVVTAKDMEALERLSKKWFTRIG